MRIVITRGAAMGIVASALIGMGVALDRLLPNLIFWAYHFVMLVR